LISCALAFVSGDVRTVSSTILRSVGRLAIDVFWEAIFSPVAAPSRRPWFDLHWRGEGRGRFVQSYVGIDIRRGGRKRLIARLRDP
jgi:hypothetical protein